MKNLLSPMFNYILCWCEISTSLLFTVVASIFTKGHYNSTEEHPISKFILNNYTSYKSRLIQLNLLPLMYQYELNNLLFESLLNLTNHPVNSLIFDNLFISDPRSSSTGLSSASKLVHQTSVTNNDQYFYFCRISRLQNSLPQIDMNLPPTTIKNLLTQYFQSHFLDNFDIDKICTFHFCCPVIANYQTSPLIFPGTDPGGGWGGQPPTMDGHATTYTYHDRLGILRVSGGGTY